MLDRAVHCRAAPILLSELQPSGKVYTDSEVFEETKVGKVVFYIDDLVHTRVQTPIICQNLKIDI